MAEAIIPLWLHSRARLNKCSLFEVALPPSQVPLRSPSTYITTNHRLVLCMQPSEPCRINHLLARGKKAASHHLSNTRNMLLEIKNNLSWWSPCNHSVQLESFEQWMTCQNIGAAFLISQGFVITPSVLND